MKVMKVFDIENQRLIATTRSDVMKSLLRDTFYEDCFDIDGHLCIEGSDLEDFYTLGKKYFLHFDILREVT